MPVSIQCFANGDQSTLDYIARRLENLIAPFELRTAFRAPALQPAADDGRRAAGGGDAA